MQKEALLKSERERMIETILDEMRKGNFSFLILVVGVIQEVIMWRKKK